MDFVRIPESDQTFSGYLKKSLDMIYAVRRCPVNRMTLCVTSEPELEKCVKMKVLIKLQIYKCMQLYKIVFSEEIINKKTHITFR